MAADMLEKLNLSNEEMSKLSKAMKDPKFMELLNEYSEEISKPSSKEEAEGYIQMMEERSNFCMDGKELIIPQVDFCAKTRNRITNGKVFINICHSDKVATPTATPRSDKSGVQWEIPYSLAPTRRDKDKVGNDCEVHDFVVSTETHTRAEESRHFKKFLVETAMDAIEKQRGVKLDREFSLPKLTYKGPTKVPKLLTVPKDKIAPREKTAPKDLKGTRRKKPDMVTKPSVPTSTCNAPLKQTSPDRLKSGRPPAPKGSSRTKAPEMDSCSEGTGSMSHIPSTSEGSGSTTQREDPSHKAIDTPGATHSLCEESGPVEPPYELIYRNKVDYGDFWNDSSRSLKEPCGPQDILLRVFLPEVKSADEIELDVCDRDIVLKVGDIYYLKVALSFAVDEASSVAKFDKNKMKLEVTLPTCISAGGSDRESVVSSCKDSVEKTSDKSSDGISEDMDEAAVKSLVSHQTD